MSANVKCCWVKKKNRRHMERGSLKSNTSQHTQKRGGENRTNKGGLAVGKILGQSKDVMRGLREKETSSKGVGSTTEKIHDGLERLKKKRGFSSLDSWPSIRL